VTPENLKQEIFTATRVPGYVHILVVKSAKVMGCNCTRMGAGRVGVGVGGGGRVGGGGGRSREEDADWKD
jgi:hypothetical protein